MQNLASCCIALRRVTTFLMLAISACLCLCSIASGNDELSNGTTSIDSREEELKRKEQELLQAIELSSTTAQASSGEQIQVPAEPSNTVIRVFDPSVELNSLEEPKAAEPFEQETQPRRIKRSTALSDLKNHPALEPPKKVSAHAASKRAQVRTKSYEHAPDGTTARRIGSFYRVERGEDAMSPIWESGGGHVIPLEEMSPINPIRAALLTSDEIATIRDSGIYLRTGPTRLDSALLKLPQYSEVSIDYRSGTWYRVRTENGVRGWIPGSSLLFDADIPPDSTVQVSGVR